MFVIYFILHSINNSTVCYIRGLFGKLHFLLVSCVVHYKIIYKNIIEKSPVSTTETCSFSQNELEFGRRSAGYQRSDECQRVLIEVRLNKTLSFMYYYKKFVLKTITEPVFEVIEATV